MSGQKLVLVLTSYKLRPDGSVEPVQKTCELPRGSQPVTFADVKKTLGVESKVFPRQSDTGTLCEHRAAEVIPDWWWRTVNIPLELKRSYIYKERSFGPVGKKQVKVTIRMTQYFSADGDKTVIKEQLQPSLRFLQRESKTNTSGADWPKRPFFGMLTSTLFENSPLVNNATNPFQNFGNATDPFQITQVPSFHQALREALHYIFRLEIGPACGNGTLQELVQLDKELSLQHQPRIFPELPDDSHIVSAVNSLNDEADQFLYRWLMRTDNPLPPTWRKAMLAGNKPRQLRQLADWCEELGLQAVRCIMVLLREYGISEQVLEINKRLARWVSPESA